MNYNSISIAIPTLNEELNLQTCLLSVFRQDLKGKLEVLIVDGGSTDKTIEIAKSFNVKILKNAKGDAESGKLIGLKASTSEYFMILDADMTFCFHNYLDKLLKPLRQDQSIVGAYGRYISYNSDSFLTRFVTLDPIQRDPLFRFLTADPKKVLKEKRKGYWICEYSSTTIVPHGFSLYRRKQLLDLQLDKRCKFMELDTIHVLVMNGLKRFAYVPGAKLHHPFLKNLKMLVRKRIRNLRTQFFNQPDKREFTWIDFSNKKDIFKIILWIIYANSLVLPTLVGIWRMIKYRSLIALYEPVFVWITTNLIILVFLTEKEGRKLISRGLLE